MGINEAFSKARRVSKLSKVMEGFPVAVAEKLLDGPDVVAALDEMGREGIAKGVTARAFGDAGLEDGSLHERLVHVMSALSPGSSNVTLYSASSTRFRIATPCLISSLERWQ